MFRFGQTTPLAASAFPSLRIARAPRSRTATPGHGGRYAELENSWATMIGASHVQRMRRDLTRVLTDPSHGQLPPVRPLWQPHKRSSHAYPPFGAAGSRHGLTLYVATEWVFWAAGRRPGYLAG
jgi:hypothetical protein